MSDIQPEFTDSESASFLHGDAKQISPQEGFHGRKAVRWILRSSIARFLPYMLLVAGISLVLIVVVLFTGTHEKSLLPSQSMFGKSKISILTTKVSLHMF